MVAFKTAEDALHVVVKLLAAYSDDNVSAGDYRILGTGQTEAIVTQPGPFRRRVTAAPRRVGQLWVIEIELLLQFKTEISEIAQRIRTERQTVMDHLDKYPTLDGVSGIISAFVVNGQPPQILITETRRWWRQTLVMEVETRQSTTIAE